MPARLGTLRSSVRVLLGDWAGDRADASPVLPQGLPAAVLPVATRAVGILVEYQGIDHARLYLQRLRRFIGKPGFDDVTFARIATLMAERMACEDPIRLAQLVLAAPDRQSSSRTGVFRIDELMSMLPSDIADILLELLNWLGWSRREVTRRFSAANPFGRSRLRTEAGLRRWRGLSASYARESASVERWLHMIDRAATKQPAAIGAVVETATMMRGYGDAYRQGLADWHLLINGLVKPVFDGDLVLSDLAAAIETAREAAMPDPRQANLHRTIAAIRSAASAEARGLDGVQSVL